MADVHSAEGVLKMNIIIVKRAHRKVLAGQDQVKMKISFIF